MRTLQNVIGLSMYSMNSSGASQWYEPPAQDVVLPVGWIVSVIWERPKSLRRARPLSEMSMLD